MPVPVLIRLNKPVPVGFWMPPAKVPLALPLPTVKVTPLFAGTFVTTEVDDVETRALIVPDVAFKNCAWPLPSITRFPFPTPVGTEPALLPKRKMPSVATVVSPLYVLGPSVTTPWLLPEMRTPETCPDASEIPAMENCGSRLLIRAGNEFVGAGPSWMG